VNVVIIVILGKSLNSVDVTVKSNSQLVKIIEALSSRSRLADFLHGREEHSDQDADDGDHHQQLDESEATPSSLSGKPHVEATLSVKEVWGVIWKTVGHARRRSFRLGVELRNGQSTLILVFAW
jgi:hypothetical protein